MHHARRLQVPAGTLVVAALHSVHLYERDCHVLFISYSGSLLTANNLNGKTGSAGKFDVRRFTHPQGNP
jgi:hypothetical protein